MSIQSDSEDLLFDRALRGCAEEGEWASLEARLSSDSEAAVRFVRTLRDDSELRSAVARAAERADFCEIPVPAGRTGRPLGYPRFVLATGWVAAAALLGALLLNRPSSDPPQAAPTEPAPEILAELAPELLSSRPSADGNGVEITTLRRTVQRSVVPSIEIASYDDAGQLVLRPAAPTAFSLPTSL